MIFNRKHLDKLDMTFLRRGVYAGKVTQRVKLKVSKLDDEYVELTLTDFYFRGEHPLMDGASAGPWAESKFRLKAGDDVELDFKVDLPVTIT